jgi:hypothetical protein
LSKVALFFPSGSVALLVHYFAGLHHRDYTGPGPMRESTSSTLKNTT